MATRRNGNGADEREEGGGLDIDEARTPRGATERAAFEAPTNGHMGMFRPGTSLSAPKLGEGVSVRWLAEYVGGVYQHDKLSVDFAEGWRWVRLDEVQEKDPDFALIHDPRDREDPEQPVRRGGMRLARRDKQVSEARDAYYLNMSKQRVAGANRLQGIGGERGSGALPSFHEDYGTHAGTPQEVEARRRNVS